MKEMVDEIKKEPGQKKNRRMAEALAKDLEAFTGSKCEAMEGGVGRKSRHTGLATPGYFIRTIVYKVAWETFIEKKDALEVSRLMKKALNTALTRQEIKEVQQDFGILETLDLLVKYEAKLDNVERVYAILAKSLKFGIE